MDEVWQEQLEANCSGYDDEEAYIYHTMNDVDDIIKRYGVKFFIENLPRYSKIAIIAFGKEKK
jgi:hypothetical protein